MSHPARIELQHRLDHAVLAEVLELIDGVTEAEGHRPVGEHKYAHLRVGAASWTGVLAYDRDNRLVGYAHMRWNPRGTLPRMAVEVVAHPAVDDDAVATDLLAAVEEVLALAGGGALWLWVHRVEDPQTTLAAKLGYQVQRELAFMGRPLEARPEPDPPPDGVTLRPYAGEADDAEFLRVNNAAFASHPENGDWDAATFAQRRALPWFDPEGLLMAWRGDRLVGFHWTKWHGHASDEVPAHGPVGEVYVLAVDPGVQGEGLGRFLLESGLAHLYDRGCRQAVLYVDNAEKAPVALYTSAGFTLTSLEVCYERVVEPALGPWGDEFNRPALD